MIEGAITEEQITRIAEWMNEGEHETIRVVASELEPPVPKGSKRQTGALQTVELHVRAVTPAQGPIYSINSIGEMRPDPAPAEGGE